MKKILVLSMLAIFCSTVSLAQETTSKEVVPTLEKKHEVRLGAIKLLSGSIVEGVYEYVQNSNTGFGAALLINLNPDNEYLEDYSITPFYRMYFQTKEDYGAKGFFVEGFTSFFGGKNYNNFEFNNNQKDEDFFDISVGLGLGKKWINSSGFVFEAKFGGGRNLLNGSELDFILKGDLYIGYRF